MKMRHVLYLIGFLGFTIFLLSRLHEQERTYPLFCGSGNDNSTSECETIIRLFDLSFVETVMNRNVLCKTDDTNINNRRMNRIRIREDSKIEGSINCGEGFVTSIHLSRLKEFPIEVVDLSHLRELSLKLYNLTFFPPEIGNLTNLTYLSVGVLGANNYVEEPVVIPSEVGKLTNLTEFHWIGIAITKLPAEVGNLSNLTVLKIERTGYPYYWYDSYRYNSDSHGLTVLPSEIRNLKNLHTLSIYHSPLTSIPPELYFLENLSYVSLPSFRDICFDSNNKTIGIQDWKQWANSRQLFAFSPSRIEIQLCD